MTRQFEAKVRDGAARLGTLIWRDQELPTPHTFESKDELEFLQELISCKTEIDVTVVPAEGDAGAEQSEADIVVLAAAARLRGDPRGLTEALLRARQCANPDSALYVPALATPQNLSLLVYAGADLVDSIAVEVKAREGYFLDADGERRCSEVWRRPCVCRACNGTDVTELSFEQKVTLAAEHNKESLRVELSKIAEHIERGTLRELVEGRCRAAATTTALLRLLDKEYRYFERRSPIVRIATLRACSQESLNRPEIRRFNERVVERLQRRAGVLLLLPCSARKPYSTSRSHRIVGARLGKLRQYLNEAIITSPIGVVPRSLEILYPASNYDAPVTGKWTCDEREWVIERLSQYLSANAFESVIAHVSGPYRQISDAATAPLGIEVVYTVDDDDILSPASLERLRSVAHEQVEAFSPPRRDLRFDIVRDLADYEFGPQASEAIFPRTPKIRGLFPMYYASERGERIATITGKYHTLALTVDGARRYLNKIKKRYCVRIDDFMPRGTVFAVGVLNADPEIRPLDEVIVANDKVIGVGRALMSGWEMQASKKGSAVAVRHLELL
ncbi:MAG TPA: archaeosine synthase subunit alpha [Candidatus Acidoferrales bacterium]|nr:archaeosine synthase subunit alpha [Candidatus Acidoferrales bacterium]